MGSIKQFLLYMTLLSAAWSDVTETNDNITSTTPSVDVDDKLATAINEFGYKLSLELMKQHENKNVIISPVSIAGLLAMILLGTVGNTYDELAKTLGFSQDILSNRKIHDQFGKLLEELNANDTSSRTLYANAIYVDLKTQLRKVYQEYLERVYHGAAFAADFTEREKVKETINEWVKSHTNGKIDDFLKQPLLVDTKVVLLSALYFKGQWEQPFLPEYTRKMAFKTPSAEVMADLMLNAGRFDYVLSVDDDLHMMALPYNDSITTMYVLKPRLSKKQSLLDLMNTLSYEKINTLINKMTKKELVIRFPKMELKSNVKLEKTLKDLGVKSIFTPGKANFALMIDSNTVANKTEEELIIKINTGEAETKGLKETLNSLPNPGVHVDVVLHDVQITINEYGTEAVAASAAILARTVVQFYADSPFFMFIRNERTKLVTFSAIIFDPTT